MRWSKILQLRRAIAAGTYPTPTVLAAAAEALEQQLGIEDCGDDAVSTQCLYRQSWSPEMAEATTINREREKFWRKIRRGLARRMGYAPMTPEEAQREFELLADGP